ncbi:hypothetical protein VNI00_015085 [Paramarasmius palmivorus]|uniref:F-box domain-containing protein n=1 Tax=Paramarasmius palmivorus TaxID=297713 RepID=A0AAW0BPG0_9AGAR
MDKTVRFYYVHRHSYLLIFFVPNQDTVAVVPQEVLEIILGNLDRFKDRESLRQCALTARCLLPAAQRALFRSISLTTIYESKGCAGIENFRGLLEQAPHLANYPTHLCLDLQPSDWGELLFDAGSYPFVISRLQNLERMDICIFRENRIGLTSLQLYILLGGTQAPKIRCLQLSGMESKEAFGFVGHLAAHRSLQELQLWDVLPTETQAPALTWSPLPAVPTVQLRTFHVDGNVTNTLSWATSANSCLRFTELRELTIGDLTEQSCPPLARVLEAAKDSLTCLNFMGPDIEFVSSFQFDMLRHLRTISYTIPRIGPTISYHSPLGPSSVLNPWCSALKRGNGLKLDKFIVRMDFGTVRIPSRSESEWDPADGFVFHSWEDFEAALISGTRTRQLELQIVDSNRRITTDVLRDYLSLCHSGTGASSLCCRE